MKGAGNIKNGGFCNYLRINNGYKNCKTFLEEQVPKHAEEQSKLHLAESISEPQEKVTKKTPPQTNMGLPGCGKQPQSHVVLGLLPAQARCRAPKGQKWGRMDRQVEEVVGSPLLY